MLPARNFVHFIGGTNDSELTVRLHEGGRRSARGRILDLGRGIGTQSLAKLRQIQARWKNASAQGVVDSVGNATPLAAMVSVLLTLYVSGFSKTAPRKPRPSGDIKETWSMAAWMLDVSSPPVGVTVTTTGRTGERTPPPLYPAKEKFMIRLLPASWA